MKQVRANPRLWIAGTLLAFAGVIVARIAAPTFAAGTPRVACTVVGQLVALGGLGLICIGVSRRIRRDATEM